MTDTHRHTHTHTQVNLYIMSMHSSGQTKITNVTLKSPLNVIGGVQKWVL